MKILISRLSSLGDTVCCLPAASAMKASYPDCRISWIVDPRFAPIVERCSSVDHVIRYRFKFGKWVHFEEKFDIAMDLQGLLKSSWPVACCRANLKVGYHWQREGSQFFTRRVIPDPSSLHVVDQYVDVARAAGGRADRAAFNLVPSPEDVERAKQLLGSVGAHHPYVVMNPTAAWVSKRWPITKFAGLIDRLAHHGLQAVLVGGTASEDIATCQAVVESCQEKPFDLSGKTNLEELVALIKLSCGHVGGDTGTSHIAAALDVPAIGLYSITLPQRSCPYGQINGCIYNPEGLEKIEVDEVFNNVLSAVS